MVNDRVGVAGTGEGDVGVTPELIETAMTWALSATTCLSMWFYGDKDNKGPWIGCFSQALWWVFIFAGSHIGMIPGAAAMTYIHIRNLRKYTGLA